MKKWLILLGAVGLVLVAWYVIRGQRYVAPWAMPRYGEVTRGDIRVPITASGLIQAEQVLEVKSEASGEIMEIRVREGSFVRAGDELVVLKKDDEQRALDRANAELQRATIALAQAEVAVRKAEQAIESAAARVEDLAAQAKIAAYDWNKAQEEMQAYSEQEMNRLETTHLSAKARLREGRAAWESAKLNQEDARNVVLLQSKAKEVAETTVGDAAKRLSDTTIRSRRDAIVTSVPAKVGQLVQAGTSSFTGGTVLLMLADVSSKKVLARVDEADYGTVLNISPIDSLPDMPGMREHARANAEQMHKRSGAVRITVDAFPTEAFTGRIDRVEPQGKQIGASSVIQYEVHVVLTGENASLLPLGAQAQVEFTVESESGVLRVPAEAVKAVGAERGVWVKAAPGPGEQFGRKFLSCTFGITDGEFTHLVATNPPGQLKEADQVYIKLPADTTNDKDDDE